MSCLIINVGRIRKNSESSIFQATAPQVAASTASRKFSISPGGFGPGGSGCVTAPPKHSPVTVRKLPKNIPNMTPSAYLMALRHKRLSTNKVLHTPRVLRKDEVRRSASLPPLTVEAVFESSTSGAHQDRSLKPRCILAVRKTTQRICDRLFRNVALIY
ncbi:hypothetical protein TcasGA2_TC010397 [Tribolium castaneum]|uniref:Uncharacterized protein n=1 Tax=Tribolium castaneum TaxID=7070 RepID=D6WKT3_TRICA|nr:hypothetical protein TcasGA2_TC010397 [Tribolium castaneum]